MLFSTPWLAAAAPGPSVIEGRVLAADGETPAAGVEVTLSDTVEGTAQVVTTDVEGRFRFDALAAGEYALYAEADAAADEAVVAIVLLGAGAHETVELILDGEGALQTDAVTVVQAPSAGEQLERSAQAVKVVDTEEARKETADLGEVLARSSGVGVRRGGGLGSGTRFSLNGLTDDQVRFFLDGVPLELSGYPFGIANVPVNLVERVEMYRGVVPIRFGADALGGAVNLVSLDGQALEPGFGGAASYQAGSFGTHRLTLSLRHLDEPSGVFVRVAGFLDVADNDYPVDVEVPDDRGRLADAEVHRFHDAYRAVGGNVEVGMVDRPWADRLLLRAWGSEYHKELQHNVVMSVPYGEVEYGAHTAGATLRYEHTPVDALEVRLIGGYGYERTRLLDVGECVYDWFGQCVRERVRPGELDGRPTDVHEWQHTGFGRVALELRPHPLHILRVASSLLYEVRTGDERNDADPNSRDPLNAERTLATVVSGLEYETNLVDDRFQGIVFVKDYFQGARSEEPPVGGGDYLERDRDTHRLGVGASLRFRIHPGIYAKASYEWATRLPRADEVFGDGVLITPNLELEPEVSHNVNVGVTVDVPETVAGAWRLDLNGFLRETDDLIVLLGNDRAFTYANVFGARSLGFEATAGWTSPGEYVALDGNVTWLDFRNASSEGTFGDFDGDRIPNRPYFFVNASARVQLRQVATTYDALSLVWHTRFVREFFRSWESVGRRDSKQSIPDQLIHSIALTYAVQGEAIGLTFTGEVQNVTDALAFDFFGVQRPGRAAFFKITAEL